jgi:hypothetical protein
MPIPATPSGFLLQQANLQVLLTWNNVPLATSYPIWRSTDNVNYTQIANPTVSKYIDTAVIRGTQYFYKIGSSTSSALFAFGSINFTANPLNGETFSVANTVFTAVTSGATGNQFNIGLTLASTLNNIVSSVTGNTSLNFIVTAAVSSNSVVFTAYQPGTEGNGIQLSSGLSNTSVTGFSGGVTGS